MQALVEFARFLKDNLLNEMATESKWHGWNFSFMQFHSSLPEDVIISKNTEDIESLLDSIIDGTLLEKQQDLLGQWQSGHFNELPQSTSGLEYFLNLYSVEKQLLMKFITRYTPESKVAMEILSTLEYHYQQIQHETIQAFSSERMKAEEIIKSNEEKLRQLIEAMPVGVYVLDNAGKPFYANKIAKKLLGKGIVLDAEMDELSKIYQAYIVGTNEIYPMDKMPVSIAIKNKEISYIDDVEIHREDGSKIRLEILGSPITDPEGNLQYAVSTFSDITEKKNLELMREEMLHTLGGKNKELNDFAEILSHDLKIPLRNIIHLATWLGEDYKSKLDEVGNKNLEEMVIQTQKMAELIDGLLSYARAGKSIEAKEEIDLKQLIQTETEGLMLDDRKLDLKIETDLPLAYVNRSLIEPVFDNLISNAIKYSDKKNGIIRIGCTDDGEYYKFYISDNGQGIERKNYDKIFKLFQSLDNDKTVGVGLPIVKKLIELQNGGIWVESEVNKGTTFFFTLPKNNFVITEARVEQPSY